MLAKQRLFLSGLAESRSENPLMEPIEPHRCQPEENSMNPEHTIMLFGLPELVRCLAEGSEAEQLSALSIAMRRGADGLA
ncbi:MAG TPA: hypothetical protein V6D46_06035, partial [Coleofasciculaceae cyanobacterium]